MPMRALRPLPMMHRVQQNQVKSSEEILETFDLTGGLRPRWPDVILRPWRTMSRCATRAWRRISGRC